MDAAAPGSTRCGSSPLLTRVAGDGEEARRPGTTEGGGAATRCETAREAGREGRAEEKVCHSTGGVRQEAERERWSGGEERGFHSASSRGIPVSQGWQRWDKGKKKIHK